MRQMIAATNCFFWVAFWCNYMASFLWKAVTHKKSKVNKGHNIIHCLGKRWLLTILRNFCTLMRRPLSKKDNMLASIKVLICPKTSEKVHSYSLILNLRRNKYYTAIYCNFFYLLLRPLQNIQRFSAVKIWKWILSCQNK